MPSSPDIDVGARRAAAGSGRSRKAVFGAVAVFYISAALLNGRFLHEDAGKREYGWARDLWVAATRPLSQLSVLLQLDHLRGGVENLRKDPDA
jgi:hypothetical protein